MGVKITFDKNACAARIKAAAEGEALFITSKQVLDNCNYYCKQDQGTLIASSLTHSIPEKGKLIWQTPYAKKQYYLQTASKDPNQNASWMWCHTAKAEHLEKWKETFQKYFKEDLKK